jgi:hypothetical protein
MVLAIAAIATSCRQILGIDDRRVAPPKPTSTIQLPTAEQIAAAKPLAEADCNTMEACVPTSFNGRFADHDDCVEKDAIFWAAHFFGPDSAATASDLMACAATVPQVVVVNGQAKQCDAWATWNLLAGPAGCSRLDVSTCAGFAQYSPGPAIPACTPKGTRDVGAACGSGAQCASGLCSFGQTPGEPCGVCLLGASTGAKCNLAASQWCDFGNYCQGTCFGMETMAFESCVGTVCGPANVCFGPQCKPLKQKGATNCSAEHLGIATSETCDLDLVCDSAVSPPVCEDPQARALGERCGFLAQEGGPVGVCERGAHCSLQMGGTAICEADIALGGPCTTATLFGTSCAYPGVCIGGICQPAGPSACPTP